MEILKLTLVNFRNFSSLKIDFDPNLSVIVGPNGSGKSNILEAVGMLSGIRSARIETDLDLVKFGRGEAKIEGVVESSSYAKASEDKQSERRVLTINFQVDQVLLGHPGVATATIGSRDSIAWLQNDKIGRVKKAYFIDSIKKRLVDFINSFSVVEFSPLDLDLVVGSPSLRRHHLDVLLANLDRDYWRSISSYNMVVVRRNKVLARILERQSKPAELDFWDERLLEHGIVVAKKREEFFEYLNFIESANSSTPGVKGVRTPGVSLSGFHWQLKQSLLSEEKLLKNRERDIAAGMTLSGPHRDDFAFLYRDKQSLRFSPAAPGAGLKNLEYFGSRGEQRMAVLALKLAELEYVAIKRGARPVLALDDIFSELDWQHRETVLAVIGRQQTIITAAEADSVPKEILRKAKVLTIK